MADVVARTTTKTRKSVKHDRTGCLTCRQRRKKCPDHALPCSSCVRLNLVCVRDPPKQVIAHRQQASTISNSPTRDHCAPLGFQSLHEDTNIPRDKRWHAMGYYITVLANLLCVSEYHNAFLTGKPDRLRVLRDDLMNHLPVVFLPMALDSPPLASAMVAYSLGHLSLTDPTVENLAFNAHGMALRSLRKALSDGNTTSLSYATNAAACLVLVTSEVCSGYDANWVHHLIAASHLISTAEESSLEEGAAVRGVELLEKSTEGQWLLSNFAYHDAIYSVTTGSKPMLDSTKCHPTSTRTNIDTYLGIATYALRFISEISRLNSSLPGQTSLLDPLTGRFDTTRQQYTLLEESIHNWQFHTSAEVSPNLVAVANIYKSAALIYLYQSLRNLLNTADGLYEYTVLQQNHPVSAYVALDVNLQDQLLRIHTQLLAIPAEDTVTHAPLLFPLFMAGTEARLECHIELIRSRLELMYHKRKFQNIRRAIEVLDRIWDKRRSHENNGLSKMADMGSIDWRTFAQSETQDRGRLLLA